MINKTNYDYFLNQKNNTSSIISKFYTTVHITVTGLDGSRPIISVL